MNVAHQNPWCQTGSGIAFDLIAPAWGMVNFKEDVAEALARQPRFNGHVRSGTYSVAQHCVMGADELYRETSNTDLAAAFLLHDAHEAYINDITTPVIAALAYWVGRMASEEIYFISLPQEASRMGAERCFHKAIGAMKTMIDAAIYAAAGLDHAKMLELHDQVKAMDIRMLATEKRHLLGRSPLPWPQAVESAKPIRLEGKLKIWPWPDAADAYIDRLHRYVPRFQKTPTRRKGVA